MKKLALAILVGVAAVVAHAQNSWSGGIDYATDGHTYSLGRVMFSKDTLLNPRWKSVFWNFGGVIGRDLTSGVDCTGGSLLVKAQGSSGFFVGVTLNALSKEGVRGLTGQGSVLFGWSQKIKY